ncbi:hypothetical protein ACQKWADRAFT_291570 [Trichoderma austrokoningii]
MAAHVLCFGLHCICALLFALFFFAVGICKRPLLLRALTGCANALSESHQPIPISSSSALPPVAGALMPNKGHRQQELQLPPPTSTVVILSEPRSVSA